MRLAFDDQFQLAGQHVDDLFVGMLMLGNVAPASTSTVECDTRSLCTSRARRPGKITNRNPLKLMSRHGSPPPRRRTASARRPDR